MESHLQRHQNVHVHLYLHSHLDSLWDSRSHLRNPFFSVAPFVAHSSFFAGLPFQMFLFPLIECPLLSYNVLFDVRWAWEIAHSLHATDQLTQEKSLSSEVAESSEVTSLEEEVRRLREESASRRAQKAGLQGQLPRQRGFVVAVLSHRLFILSGKLQTILHENYSLQFHVRRLSHFDIAVERLNEWREWLSFLITQQSVRQCRGAVMRATTKLSPWTSLRRLRSLLNGKVVH